MAALGGSGARLRNLWPEFGNHDDRFWIHPMPDRAVPAPAALPQAAE